MKTLFLLGLIVPSFLLAQPEKLRSFELSDTIVFATIDRAGDFYAITKDGQIQKFDRDGNLKVLYKNKTVPTLFDPRDGARLFAYYRGKQEYDYLSPSFEITAAYRIDSAFVIEPWLIAPLNDHRLWVIDAADHSLKKLNPRESEVEIEALIDSTLIENAHEFRYMREYQGFVFLLNPRKGIEVFNNIGHHIRTIQVPDIHSFNFFGEELYYLHDGQLHFFDLFTAERRSIDVPESPEFLLLTDGRLLAVKGKSVNIFAFQL